jgi:hypothetical protein
MEVGMKRSWAVAKRRPQLGGQKGELLLRVGVWGLAHGQTMEQARETNRRLEGMAVPELQRFWNDLREAEACSATAMEAGGGVW